MLHPLVALRTKELREVVFGRRAKVSVPRNIVARQLQQPVGLGGEPIGERRQQFAAETLNPKQQGQHSHGCHENGQRQQPAQSAKTAAEQEPHGQDHEGDKTQNPDRDVGKGMIAEDVSAHTVAPIAARAAKMIQIHLGGMPRPDAAIGDIRRRRLLRQSVVAHLRSSLDQAFLVGFVISNAQYTRGSTFVASRQFDRVAV